LICTALPAAYQRHQRSLYFIQLALWRSARPAVVHRHTYSLPVTCCLPVCDCNSPLAIMAAQKPSGLLQIILLVYCAINVVRIYYSPL